MHTSARTGRARPASTFLGILSLLAPMLLVAMSPASGAAAVTPLSRLPHPCGNSRPPSAPAVRHVIVIQMENESQSSIIGNANAPYQTRLAATCGRESNMWAVSHPSLPNYLAENSGASHLGSFHDCVPVISTTTCVSTDDNLFHQLNQAGDTWRSYAESMTSDCQSTNVGHYVPRHNPPVYFTDLHTSTPSRCRSDDLPMGTLASRTGPFYTALAAGRLPNYTFIAPNLIDDAHSSSVEVGDAYLGKLIPLIAAAPNYQAGNTAIFVFYDEGGGTDKVTDEDCTNQARDRAGAQPSCHIPFIVVSPYEHTASVDTSFCTLYCFTRTVEALFDLPRLGHAGDATTHNLSGPFALVPTNTAPTEVTPSNRMFDVFRALPPMRAAAPSSSSSSPSSSS